MSFCCELPHTVGRSLAQSSDSQCGLRVPLASEKDENVPLQREIRKRCARSAVCFVGWGAAFSNEVFAQSVPSPWVAGDIGSPAVAGSTTYASGKFTVKAAGADIWGTSDQFRFVYQQITGDAEVIARVDSITKADAWSKAGVMIRASDRRIRHGLALVSAGNGAAFQRRTVSGGASAHTPGPAVAAPSWVRLIRLGTRVTAFISADGQTWTSMGSDTIALGSMAYVGLAATSHNATTLSTIALSNVTVVPLTVPTSQKAADIGAPAIPGTVSSSQGAYTVNAAGLDIWNTADQFHYVYQQVTGDVDVSVRVRSVSTAHVWSKSGVMIRESLSPGSRHAFALLSSARGYAFHRRIDPNGFTEGGTGVTGVTPGWVRLVRTGTTFEAFRSADGVTWISLGVDVVPMADPVYVGIATTSHNTKPRPCRAGQLQGHGDRAAAKHGPGRFADSPPATTRRRSPQSAARVLRRACRWRSRADPGTRERCCLCRQHRSTLNSGDHRQPGVPGRQALTGFSPARNRSTRPARSVR